MLLDTVDDRLALLHDTHVDDLVVVAAKHYANDVLSNVVHVTLHCRQHDGSVVLDFGASVLTALKQLLFGLHERSQVRNSSLHDSR